MKLIRLSVCVCVCVVWCLRVHVCQREFKRAIFYENELMPFFLGIKWFQGLSLELQRQTLMSPNQLCKVTRPNQEFRAQYTMLNLAFTETQHKVLSDQYHANISYTISLLLIFV